MDYIALFGLIILVNQVDATIPDTSSGCSVKGYFCVPGMNIMAMCPPGMYCPDGEPEPIPCPAGTFNDQRGMSQISDCILCPEGYFCSGTGATTPTGPCEQSELCPRGTTDDITAMG